MREGGRHRSSWKLVAQLPRHASDGDHVPGTRRDANSTVGLRPATLRLGALLQETVVRNGDLALARGWRASGPARPLIEA